ncbi:hypothetical protein H4219_002214 [Mycoemilia scoparia]|uniref:Uncharacterized protein n=1 Tax=Mycoemilia scoparia TaxID=417184 RepID=A0A9W7ZY53_9FUNG|nr:hypothetical protein H4219_002214 [Mycoemilia scoparia]
MHKLYSNRSGHKSASHIHVSKKRNSGKLKSRLSLPSSEINAGFPNRFSYYQQLAAARIQEVDNPMTHSLWPLVNKSRISLVGPKRKSYGQKGLIHQVNSIASKRISRSSVATGGANSSSSDISAIAYLNASHDSGTSSTGFDPDIVTDNDNDVENIYKVYSELWDQFGTSDEHNWPPSPKHKKRPHRFSYTSSIGGGRKAMSITSARIRNGYSGLSKRSTSLQRSIRRFSFTTFNHVRSLIAPSNQIPPLPKSKQFLDKMDSSSRFGLGIRSHSNRNIRSRSTTSLTSRPKSIASMFLLRLPKKSSSKKDSKKGLPRNVPSFLSLRQQLYSHEKKQPLVAPRLTSSASFSRYRRFGDFIKRSTSISKSSRNDNSMNTSSNSNSTDNITINRPDGRKHILNADSTRSLPSFSMAYRHNNSMEGSAGSPSQVYSNSFCESSFLSTRSYSKTIQPGTNFRNSSAVPVPKLKLNVAYQNENNNNNTSNSTSNTNSNLVTESGLGMSTSETIVDDRTSFSQIINSNNRSRLSLSPAIDSECRREFGTRKSSSSLRFMWPTRKSFSFKRKSSSVLAKRGSGFITEGGKRSKIASHINRLSKSFYSSLKSLVKV